MKFSDVYLYIYISSRGVWFRGWAKVARVSKLLAKYTEWQSPSLHNNAWKYIFGFEILQNEVF